MALRGEQRIGLMASASIDMNKHPNQRNQDRESGCPAVARLDRCMLRGRVLATLLLVLMVGQSGCRMVSGRKSDNRAQAARKTPAAANSVPRSSSESDSAARPSTARSSPRPNQPRSIQKINHSKQLRMAQAPTELPLIEPETGRVITPGRSIEPPAVQRSPAGRPEFPSRGDRSDGHSPSVPLAPRSEPFSTEPAQSLDSVRMPGPQGSSRTVTPNPHALDVLPRAPAAVDPRYGPMNAAIGQHAQADGLHGAIQDRVERYAEVDHTTDVHSMLSAMPVGYDPWWNQLVLSDRRPRGQFVAVNVDQLVLAALQHSPHVHAIETSEPIAQTMIPEAEAEFDWEAFVDTRWNQLSEPVGNFLVTGGSPRFRDKMVTGTAGMRRRLTNGAELEVSQRLGYQDNNSRFFVPTQQATSQFLLSYTQPLLNGAGETYNLSRIVLAELETDAATNDVSAQLQDHLLDVSKAYWELYRARALVAQKRRLLDQAELIHRRLSGRQNYDVLKSQLARARAAVAARNSELIRAELSVRNAETTLRVLVNDPLLLESDQQEFVPHDFPTAQYFPIGKRQSLLTALNYRPEVLRGLKQVQAASVRLGVAKKEILPTLDLVLETYVQGLQGQSDLPQSYVDQFKLGEPSYTVGLMFEVPLGQRAAKARRQRSMLELQKALHSFRATMEVVGGEVESAVRAAESAYREMQSRYQAMEAAESEVQYLYERWISLPGQNGSTGWLLQDLLDSQERRAAEESAFVGSQVDYMNALSDIKRATGTLLTIGPQPAAVDGSVVIPGPVQPLSEENLQQGGYGHSVTLPPSLAPESEDGS